MPGGERRPTREANLRIGAAMAEVEGLYTALLRAGTADRRRRLQAELGRAARRLAALADTPDRPPPRAAGVRRSRRGRRRALAEHGAAWIVARYGRTGD
ncbi:hypothetical protein [Streptomyces fuscichromogenes]|uniref:Uncharacterized protein n=1 Tax=Streptomyces fuscichromogenes TaxID=1324013 RepID=A0A917XBW9_9ACTN|nr:hypothetical protein [Streptomyces fuscichromogenes]GGN06511.1 hypothetical protein GCM10011578_030680 [Streptomyces fuscichromogenes]